MGAANHYPALACFMHITHSAYSLLLLPFISRQHIHLATSWKPTLYAVQPSRYHPREANWQDYHHYTATQLSSAVRPWLLDRGSLTRRLIKVSGNQFKVQVLQQNCFTLRRRTLGFRTQRHSSWFSYRATAAIT